MKKIAINLTLCIPLCGCSVWNDEFDEPIVRAMPKASIHKISALVDRGVIQEKEESFSQASASTKTILFTDGHVSRGFEDVRRICLPPYEDENKTFHGAHHLYVVVRPAAWISDSRGMKNENLNDNK
jgi:hypothetical protein